MHHSVIEMAKTIGFHPMKQLHSLLYGRFIVQYLWTLDRLGPHLSSVAKEHLAHTYHGKVLKKEEASGILSIKEEIELTLPERVLPYRYARDLILKNPENIVVYECPCRALQRNPCKPTNVCLIVGEPFAGAATFFFPKKAHKISQAEAISIIREEDERGHIHTAYFNAAMLDRFYAICNCCRCCCIGLKANMEYHLSNIAPSGYLARISQKCIGCGVCADFCSFQAIEMDDSARVIEDRCFGCGICQSKCLVGAISMERDPRKGEPLDLESLIG